MTTTTPSITPLTEASLHAAVAFLAAGDPDLAAIVGRIGLPPLWAREAGFASCIHIILEQQVSLASARQAFGRLQAVAGPLTPERFLELDDATLRGVGFSRQKMGYGRGLAEAIQTGALDLAGLERLPDEAVRAELQRLKGVGPWTAEIYLLMALRRPDAWPSGDLALALAVQRIKGLTSRPTPQALETIAEPWRPWRAAAARLLWHDYLNPP